MAPKIWRQVILLLTLLLLTQPSPGSARPHLAYGDVVQSVSTSRPLLALTFDDGPREPYTSAVLDILRDQGVRATFFLVGDSVRRYPDVVARMSREGHAIGNHSWSHASFADLSPERALREIVGTDELIRRITGSRPWLLRPPYGTVPRWLAGENGIAARSRHLVVNWSLDLRDWNTESALRVAVGTLRRARAGGIVLLHDGGGDRAHTVRATRWVVGHLARDGFHLVTVPELLEAGQ